MSKFEVGKEIKTTQEILNAFNISLPKGARGIIQKQRTPKTETKSASWVVELSSFGERLLRILHEDEMQLIKSRKKRVQCRKCKRKLPLNRKGFCAECAEKRFLDAIGQMKAKEGPFYDKYKREYKKTREKRLARQKLGMQIAQGNRKSVE